MHIPRFAPTDQTRLPHHALDSLVIDLPALPAFGLSSSGDSHNQQRLCAADASPGRGIDRDPLGQRDDDAGNTIADCC
jgi:hypothetical protein